MHWVIYRTVVESTRFTDTSVANLPPVCGVCGKEVENDNHPWDWNHVGGDKHTTNWPICETV